MQTKICNHCKKEKLISEFYKNRAKKDGLSDACKICKYGFTQKYRKTPKGKKCRRKSQLKQRYNLTPEQHKKLYLIQNGCCIICNKPIEYNKIQVDHNHKTGKIRGLICFTCNVLLGYLERMKNDGFIEKAEKYLKDHSG